MARWPPRGRRACSSTAGFAQCPVNMSISSISSTIRSSTQREPTGRLSRRLALTELETAFTELEPWPDAHATLLALRARGLRLAPLANFAPSMIERLLKRVGMYEMFDDWISTDRGHTYKPEPRAYALAETAFGLPRRSIAFAAFGGWDAAGGRWYGFPTFWVNRLGAPLEQLVPADASGPDLQALASWLSRS